MRIQIVMRLIGGLLLIIAGVTVIPFLYGITIGEVYWSFPVTAVAIALLGGLLVYFGEKSNSYSLRDGFLVVSAMWVLSALFMAVPFYASHIIPHFTDALFESTSGITATGASIIDDVDSLPKSFILWRSLTHWLGGMGIVVLMLAFCVIWGLIRLTYLMRRRQYQDRVLFCHVYSRQRLSYGVFTLLLQSCAAWLSGWQV